MHLTPEKHLTVHQSMVGDTKKSIKVDSSLIMGIAIVALLLTLFAVEFARILNSVQ